MIKVTNKANCCGCGACAQCCPLNCIAMLSDEEGFLYPSVDTDRCVDCGLCVKVCPILSKNESGLDQQVMAFAAYAKDEKLREESSSGGVFSVLAEWILNQNGVVFGAAFDDNFSVHHVMVERKEDLLKLRGSKYTQSKIEDTYRLAKQQLETGRLVLFSGVGCQIAGLKSFLRKEYENLYTVDVLCHGVPSPKVWNKYLDEQERLASSKVSSISFRNKSTGWKKYSVAIRFVNGNAYVCQGSDDGYMKLFLRDICLRPSCHDCSFKDIVRVSDFTLGDAWGIENTMPEMDDDKGTSVVLIHSKKAQDLWERLESRMCKQQGDADQLLPPRADSRRSVQAHPNRNKFFAALYSGADLEQLLKLTNKSFFRRCLSFGKRSFRKILKILKI